MTYIYDRNKRIVHIFGHAIVGSNTFYTNVNYCVILIELIGRIKIRISILRSSTVCL